MAQYVCLECGWIYDEAKGHPASGVLPGTKWEDVPMDFKCPECTVRKSDTHMWEQVG